MIEDRQNNHTVNIMKSSDAELYQLGRLGSFEFYSYNKSSGFKQKEQDIVSITNDDCSIK
jgi:hypothetical protein